MKECIRKMCVKMGDDVTCNVCDTYYNSVK